MTELALTLATEEATETFGLQLGKLLTPPLTIYLQGDLGVGKTRLSRAILHGLGHTGVVKSPTYTLVEPYQLQQMVLYHFDLYRLSEPSELDYMGIRDYFTDNTVALVEWPTQGQGYLNPADLSIELSFDGEGRRAIIRPHTKLGDDLLSDLKQNL